jgi:hypothetical protein
MGQFAKTPSFISLNLEPVSNVTDDSLVEPPKQRSSSTSTEEAFVKHGCSSVKDTISFDGILSYTIDRKHSGNVQDKRIVTIASKLVRDDDPNCEMRLISFGTRVSSQRTSQVSEFAGIYMKCPSARLTRESKLTA